MLVIHKYILPMKENTEVEMPAGARVISGEMQDGFIVVWAIVSDAAVMVKKKFKLYKTGQSMNTDVNKLKYIGIAKVKVGMELGMHIFEVMN